MRRRRLLLLAFFGLAAQIARADNVSFVIQESALNKFAGAAGNISGTAGPYEVTDRCFPDWWHTCTLYSGTVSWTLSGVQFHVTPSGITFSGNLNAAYSNFTSSVGVTGTAQARYDGDSSRLVISLDTLSATVTFNLDHFGSWSPPPLTISPNYGFNLPVGPTGVSVTIVSVGTLDIQLRPRNVMLSLQDGSLRLDTEFAIW